MAGFQGVLSRPRAGDRAQSNVVSVVLVIGITIAGITGVLIFGATALEDARSQSEVGAAGHAMTQLDSTFSLVALGSADYQSSPVQIRSGASLTVDEDRGWMNVSVVNQSTGGTELTVFNTTLGAVVYEKDGTTVAYQGGGVWKGTNGGSTMVSPPEFHYRTNRGEEPTLTLPLVVVRGGGSIAEQAVVTRDETVAKYPEPGNADRTNPLEGGKINVTVRSEYYRAWGAFFESRTGGSVSFDHDRERVTITLVIDKDGQQVQGGIVSGSSGYTLEFGQGATVDSYNSTGGGGYVASDNTSIYAAGDVDLGNNAEIKGNLVTAKTVSFGNNNAQVTGNVTYGTSKPDESHVGGWVKSGAEVTPPDSVGWLIEERRATLSDPSNNDNDEVGSISSNTLTGCNPCELDGGAPSKKYHLDGIDLDGSDELVLDTTSGDIEVVVDGDVDVKGDGNDPEIRVEGDGTARVYVTKDLSMTSNANATVPDERSPGLWFYMKPGRSAEFQSARFVGVVYGPGNGAQPGVTIELPSNNEVYGGLVGYFPATGNGAIGQQDAVHFDEALVVENPLGTYGNDQPTVTYMHVTLNRVNVSSR